MPPANFAASIARQLRLMLYSVGLLFLIDVLVLIFLAQFYLYWYSDVEWDPVKSQERKKHNQAGSTTQRQQNMVAFRLASMSQHRRDEGLVYEAGFLLESATSHYDFKTEGMMEFFGGRKSLARRAIQDTNDPHGLLGSRINTEAQLYLTDFLLEPARMQYRMETLVNDGMHKSIFKTNPGESYWDQLEALQIAFQRDWAEMGRTGHPLLLYGLLKLDYNTMKSKIIHHQINPNNNN